MENSILKIILEIIIGIASGSIISAGVFALITSTGVMTRFADKTHTARHVLKYENAVVLGATLFNVFWIFKINMTFMDKFAPYFLSLLGITQGVFVGCLAVSLAEALNATAIFARRARLKTGLSFIVLCGAIGKCLGAFWHLLIK